MKGSMQQLIIDKRTRVSKKRRIKSLSHADQWLQQQTEPLSDVEKWFIESLESYLENFHCKRSFFGFVRTWQWTDEKPKTTIRMFLWTFDKHNGTDYLRRIFGDEPVPDFILRNKNLSQKLCWAIIDDLPNNSRDFDDGPELFSKIEGKFND